MEFFLIMIGFGIALNGWLFAAAYVPRKENHDTRRNV